MIPSTQCKHELLAQSLHDSLSDLQEEELARHLSECPSCQRELERLAAEGDAWTQVGEALRRESRLSQAIAEAPGDPPYDAAADFAVDFLEPSSQPHTLGRLGDIDILDAIGRGGMGIVLKGFQPELNRPVAVKVLAPHLATNGAARRRFAREAQATAVIVHPNVMPILTVNSTGKLPYLVMPYVACESLQQRLDRDGPLELLDVLRIAVQAARGLAAAHAQGLVHRDVKPANILLEKGIGRVMLTDFGLARAVDDATLTRTGVIAGTPQYMSPEQARGEPVDARSDLFSLGSVLYAICTGRPPFRAETSYGILRRITDVEPRAIGEINPQIPGWLIGVVARLHAKDPGGRFASAAEVADLLEQCLAHVQQPTVVALPEAVRWGDAEKAVEKPAPQRGRSFSRGKLVGAASAIVLCAALGIVYGIQSNFGSSPTPEPSASGTASSTAKSSANEKAIQNSDSDPAADWNAVEERIDELLRDEGEFRRRVEQPWDRRPTRPSPESQYPTPLKPETELMP